MVKIKILRTFDSTTLGRCEKYQIRQCSDALAKHFESIGLASIIKERIETKPEPIIELETKPEPAIVVETKEALNGKRSNIKRGKAAFKGDK